MCYVYVLENEKGRHYVGNAEDIGTRLKRHNQNSVRSTKNKGPWNLIYQEKCSGRTEARKRENEIKGYKGDSRFKALLKK